MKLKEAIEKVNRKKITNGRTARRVLIKDEFGEVLADIKKGEKVDLLEYADCQVTECRCSTKNPSESEVDVFISIIKKGATS